MEHGAWRKKRDERDGRSRETKRNSGQEAVSLFGRYAAINCLDDLNGFYDFYDFYGFNDLNGFNDFNGFPFTACCLRLERFQPPPLTNLHSPTSLV
jgi:hypothetical protein